MVVVVTILTVTLLLVVHYPCQQAIIPAEPDPLLTQEFAEFA
jgi:hypothetical protein